MNPCCEGLNRDLGREMVFSVPSPLMVELVCQMPTTKLVRYRILWLKPDSERNWNWKFAPLFVALSKVTGNAARVSVTLASKPDRKSVV